ncbi:MAG: precorrin-4 C(11)-methyltransferase [Nitrospirota bacterium]
MSNVFFIGAGPGDPDLMTIKAGEILARADLVIYAGSLVNPDVLKFAKPGATVHDSASMELAEIIEMIKDYAAKGKTVARVHTGEPSLYGAIAEQMAELDKAGIDYEVVPGVSSAFAAAAALRCELTLPEVSQTVIFTRISGRTEVPGEESLASLSKHRATMAIFLSVGEIERVVKELLQGYPEDTPAAVVYKASWPEEKVIRGTLSDIAGKAREEKINKTALILVGKALDRSAIEKYSKLYDKDFSHQYRK